MSFKEEAIKRVKNYLSKNELEVEITRISNVYDTRCEWCENETNVIHIGLSRDKHGIAGQMTIFEDPSFHLQSEWWVCGKCENS